MILEKSGYDFGKNIKKISFFNFFRVFKKSTFYAMCNGFWKKSVTQTFYRSPILTINQFFIFPLCIDHFFRHKSIISKNKIFFTNSKNLTVKKINHIFKKTRSDFFLNGLLFFGSKFFQKSVTQRHFFPSTNFTLFSSFWKNYTDEF